MKLLPTINVNLLFTIIVISTLGYYSYVSYERIERLNKEADKVSHSYLVKLRLEQTITYLQDAGTAQRGYLLTNNPSFLHAFNVGMEKTNKTVDEIDLLTKDNTRQQQNIRTLKNLIDERYKLLSFLLAMKNSVSAATVLSASQFEDKNKLDTIRTQIASMVRVEDLLLKEREKAKKSLSSTTPLYSLVLSLASLLVIFIGVYQIRNGVKKQARLKEELSYSKSFLQNILNSTRNGIGCYEAIRNAAGKITDFRIGYINKEITTLYGLMPENIIGKTLDEVFPGFSGTESFNFFCSCVENGNHVEYETESNFNDVHVWLYIQLEKLHDGLTVTFRDITEEKKEAILQLRQHNKALAKANADLAAATQKTKQLNEKLLIQNEIFKQAEESSLQGSYSWNLSTGEATFSDNMYRLLGCEPGEFTPSLDEVLKYVHPEDQDYVKDISAKISENNNSLITRHRIISKDGKLKYIQGTGKIINYANIKMIVGTMRDITADTLLNQHIKFREAQLTQAQNIAKLGSFYNDFLTNTVTWSDELYRLYGYEPGEIEVNEKNVSNVHPEDLPALYESEKNALEKGIPVDIEYRRKDKNGKLRYVYSKAEVIRDSSENIIGLFGVNMDLTDLREKEKQLKESERFNRAILDLAPNVVHIYDLKKRKNVFINKNILSIAGYTGKEMQDFGMDVTAIMHPEDLGRMSAHHEKCKHLKDGAILEIEYRVKNKQGNYIYLLSSDTVFTRNHKGEVTQIIGVTIDITEIKKTNEALISANQELERSNQELTSFTYVASHDLQEPLRKIRIFISRILNEQLSESNKELFSRIISSVGRMNELIESLLNYSRANTTAINKEETDLNIVVEEVKTALHHIIEEKNAVVELSELPKINVVRMQFLQLFTNIIENGIKYSKPGIPPHIQISAQMAKYEEMYACAGVDPKTDYWKISVTDNGIGFEQEYEDKIFDMFQRLHSKAEYNGTGIGLAICKKVIQNHDGFITATGKPGIGSTFDVFIPMHSNGELQNKIT